VPDLELVSTQAGLSCGSRTATRSDLHVARCRLVQVPLAPLLNYNAAMADLDALEQEVITRQRATAWPKPHFYEIVPKGNPARTN
jgi:hypothetical protein